MSIYNSQTNNNVIFQNQIEKMTTGGGNNEILETPFHINIISITNNKRVSFIKEEQNITQEEEKDYYQKTLKGKLI